MTNYVKFSKYAKSLRGASMRGAPVGKVAPIISGPVSSITTAPVAIGNSVRGSKTLITPRRGGVSAIGRDFMYTPIGSGSVVTWTVVGGSPLTPAAFSDSTLRQYMQMYQKFKWNRVVVHYITSSPTSSNGDVMFYYAKNRANVFLNQTSTQLLPFVMSDPNTVIGPQWTNHSAELEVTSNWLSTDYGMTQNVDNDAAGEIFLLSKTSTTDSPGYVVFDYEIEFKDMQITPRLLTLPLPRIQYTQVNLGVSGAVLANGVAYTGPTGNNISATPSSYPTGATIGDVYKVIIDLTNSSSSSWTNITTSGFRFITGGNNIAVTLVDGTTLYGTYTASGFVFYPTLDNAVTGTGAMSYTTAGTVTWNLQVWLSLATTISTTNLNPNF